MEKFTIASSEGPYEWCEENGVSSYSPYYDADHEDCIFGNSVATSGDYSYAEVQPGLDERIQQVQSRLLKQFGKQPKVYIMAHGW
ncbi:hypothetical protein D3C84_793940 [compost metagenome]